MKLVIIFLMSLLCVNFALSLQTESCINQITDTIYQTCKGQDIQLKENWFISSDQKRFVNEIKWPYDNQTILGVINYISGAEPYSATDNMFMSGEIDIGGNTYKYNNKGDRILTCGGNILDVYGRDYLWNNVEQCTGGKGNLDTTGLLRTDYFENVMKDNFWSGFWVALAISLLVGVLSNYLFLSSSRKKNFSKQLKKLFKK
jgi:hypothetical protein